MSRTARAVLIIENDLATAQMYQRTLNQHYQVLTTTIEQDVMAVVSANTFHAVILEPGPLVSRGWALLAELQRHPSTQSTPIIICTSQDRQRLGLGMSVAAYLVKPVLPATLLKVVQQLIGEPNQPDEPPVLLSAQAE
jgi:DNA-binding response OmpR family regulator